MSVHAAPPPSRLAVWRSLETRVDRWTSFGALALGLAAFAVVLALQLAR